MVLVVFPLTTLKDLTALVRFNSLGVFFLFFNIFFIIYHGISEAVTVDQYGRSGWDRYILGSLSHTVDMDEHAAAHAASVLLDLPIRSEACSATASLQNCENQ